VQDEEKRGLRRRKNFVESTCKREDEDTKSERVEIVQEIEERETRKKRISTLATCKLDIKKRSGIRDTYVARRSGRGTRSKGVQKRGVARGSKRRESVRGR